jgi:hypothetical protein
MKNLLEKIRPILDEQQCDVMDQLIAGGASFHSLFRDGSVELMKNGKPLYVVKNGKVMGK